VIVAQMHLDGFGHFRDHRIDLDPGLTLIHGPNEAGKSTLRAFLTWVLFGTRRGQGGEGARWQPQSGGIAGSLLLVDGDRRYRIQRIGSTIRVHGPGLPSSGDEALGALLPRADRGLFETVFSVDGFDLAEAGSLGGQRVQEVLMAGAFTGTAAPRDAIATLADAAKALWGPRSGQIRELNHELTERRRSMREAQRAVLAYGRARDAHL
jgi:uncharacterized protein YhaN